MCAHSDARNVRSAFCCMPQQWHAFACCALYAASGQTPQVTYADNALRRVSADAARGVRAYEAACAR
eukprot:11164897-Lingulodinium_polyedra.AAC.1